MKAMILAAGRGERLKPLTTVTPKPLLMIGATTLLAHVLRQVRAAGITEVIINVHHLGDQIIEYCGNGARFGMHIQYSVEDVLLETGGGILRALPLLGESPFLVMSADIWTDYPIEKMLQKQGEDAHLVFVDNPVFHPQGDYALDAQNKVRDDLPGKLTYGNIGVMHPRLFAEKQAGFFKLNEVLRPAIAAGRVTGEHYTGRWFNVGTEAELHHLREVVNKS